MLKKNPIISILLIFTLSIFLLLPTLSSNYIKIHAESPEISVNQYDKMKNCTSDLSKHPDSIEYLTYFNCGHISRNTIGQTIRDFTLIVEENRKIPITNDGLIFNGWTFNGTIPGPTIRVTEGDLVRITVINSKDNRHPHSFHTHSVHPAEVDGVSLGGYPGGAIAPGHRFTYEFTAQPYGVYPYHCHVDPIADHINRGLYGMMIIDPKETRKQMTEMAMLMNGYDMNYEQEGPTTIPTSHLSSDQVKLTKVDENSKDIKNKDHKKEKENKVSLKENVTESRDEERDNEIYTVNGKAFDYMIHPIKLETGKQHRLYLVNMLEFDLVNSFHMHGNMFNYITAGTDETPDYKTDIVTLSQGDRGILEFQYDYPGKYMFHAHQTEFTDLGWMGLFAVQGNITIGNNTNITTNQL